MYSIFITVLISTLKSPILPHCPPWLTCTHPLWSRQDRHVSAPNTCFDLVPSLWVNHPPTPHPSTTLSAPWTAYAPPEALHHRFWRKKMEIKGFLLTSLRCFSIMIRILHLMKFPRKFLMSEKVIISNINDPNIRFAINLIRE